MSSRGSAVGALVALLCCTPAAVAQPQPPVNAPRPADHFATVNSVKLQYLDWGGHGDVLLFLTGLGASAHQFDGFAFKFTDRFRVLGLTRRGQGVSDKPQGAYDTPTLAEDIRGFLDVMHIERANVIAHSIGGIEMTAFATKYSNRAQKLVYLDAAGDSVRMLELMAQAGLSYPPYHSAAEQAINTSQSHPDFTKLTTPALAYFVIPDSDYWKQPASVLCPGCTTDMTANTRAILRLIIENHLAEEDVERFRRTAKNGRTIELRDTNHFFFQDPKYVDRVVDEIHDFLLAN
jgi:pimeloyl-ACP methyl ester carboxylesterase